MARGARQATQDAGARRGKVSRARLAAAILSGALLALVFVPAALLSLFSVLWLLPVATPLCLLLAAVALPLRPLSGWRWRLAGLVLLIAGAVVAGERPVRELQQRLDDASARLTRPGGPGAVQRVRAWSLNIAMGAGGYVVGYPEVAEETLLTVRRGPEVRVFRGDFALRSPKVRRAVAAMIRALPETAAPGARVPLAQARLSWSPAEVRSDARVALALNSPLFVDGTAVRTQAGWRLQLRATADIRYPETRTPIALGPPGAAGLVVDEALFGDLQREGWLHPYTARWEWTTDTDDPRLQDKYAVLRGGIEQVWRLAASMLR